jgi:multisubunit Na+/H+ antiporter MnhG subunit
VNVAVDALLAVAVLVAWITTAAFVRWRSGYDRLHAITFFNLVAGLRLPPLP